MLNLSLVLVCLWSIAFAKTPSMKAKMLSPSDRLVREFETRIRKSGVLRPGELKKFFELPLDYTGFDLSKNDPDCNPPQEKKKVTRFADLNPILEHFRIELGNETLSQNYSDRTLYQSEVTGDCSHVTKIRLNRAGYKIIAIEMYTDKIY